MANRDRADPNTTYNRSKRRDDDSYPGKYARKSQQTEDMFQAYRDDADSLSEEVKDFIEEMVKENGDRVSSALPESLCLQNPQAE